jgi:hypothetical protein
MPSFYKTCPQLAHGLMEESILVHQRTSKYLLHFGYQVSSPATGVIVIFEQRDHSVVDTF